jgi:hypothetical protein
MTGKKKTGVEKHLMAYAAAAVGALALVPAAEAVVHYSGPENLTLNPQNSPVTVDLNSDGANDFSFSAVSNTQKNAEGYSAVFLSLSKSGTGAIGSVGPYNYFYPARFATGYKIQNSLQNTHLIWSNRSYGTLEWEGSKYGNFNNATGCVGVRFNTDNGVRYGWIRFQGTSPSSGVIKDWAYEDSGGPIDACVVPKQAVNVPTLNQWGIMVLIALLAGMSLKALKTDKGGQDA